MECHGSNTDLEVVGLLAAEQLQKAEASLYNIRPGKIVEQAAKVRTKIISKVIELRDISTIIKLEKQAIYSEISCYGADQKRINGLAALDQIEHLIRRTITKEGATEYLLTLNGGSFQKAYQQQM